LINADEEKRRHLPGRLSSEKELRQIIIYLYYQEVTSPRVAVAACVGKHSEALPNRPEMLNMRESLRNGF